MQLHFLPRAPPDHLNAEKPLPIALRAPANILGGRAPALVGRSVPVPVKAARRAHNASTHLA